MASIRVLPIIAFILILSLFVWWCRRTHFWDKGSWKDRYDYSSFRFDSSRLIRSKDAQEGWRYSDQTYFNIIISGDSCSPAPTKVNEAEEFLANLDAYYAMAYQALEKKTLFSHKDPWKIILIEFPREKLNTCDMFLDCQEDNGPILIYGVTFKDGQITKVGLSMEV